MTYDVSHTQIQSKPTMTAVSLSSTQYLSPIPEYLTQAAQTLKAMGFKARAVAHEGYGVGLHQLPTHFTLAVVVSNGDERFQWDSHNTHITAFVAGLHAQRAEVVSPRGFDFSPGAPGEIALVSRIKSAQDATDFVECFVNPTGLDGKITGPNSKPPKQSEAMAVKSPRP